MKKEVAEYCSECENEVILQWDTEADGFETICPYCGTKLMLCDECSHTVTQDGEPHICDWNAENERCHRCKSRFQDKDNAKVMRNKIQELAYQRYKLSWCISHGVTISDIAKVCRDYWHNVEEYCIDESLEDYIEATGFAGGQIWACKEEFMMNEYQNDPYMKELLDPEMYQAYLRDVAAEKKED